MVTSLANLSNLMKGTSNATSVPVDVGTGGDYAGSLSGIGPIASAGGGSGGGGGSAQDGIGQINNGVSAVSNAISSAQSALGSGGQSQENKPQYKNGGAINLKNCKVSTHEKHKGSKSW
jgi:hypothetical protein